MNRIYQRSTGLTLLLLSLTLGLAPFTPEPHILANLRWIAGGAIGMGFESWFDTLLHGLPWALFIIWCLISVLRLFTSAKRQEGV